MQSTRLDAFMKNVDATGDCWLWTGYVMPNGYGQFNTGGRHQYAHRAALELIQSADLKGLQVDHQCWNRRCVRPDHLRTVTSRQNNENRSAGSIKASSGYRGVTWDKARNKWIARVKSGGRVHNLGRFDRIDDARAAVIEGRARLFTNYTEHDSLGVPVGTLAVANTNTSA